MTPVTKILIVVDHGTVDEVYVSSSGPAEAVVIHAAADALGWSMPVEKAGELGFVFHFFKHCVEKTGEPNPFGSQSSRWKELEIDGVMYVLDAAGWQIFSHDEGGRWWRRDDRTVWEFPTWSLHAHLVARERGDV